MVEMELRVNSSGSVNSSGVTCQLSPKHTASDRISTK